MKIIDAIQAAFESQRALFVVVISGVVGGLLAVPIQALFRTGGNLTLFAVPHLSFLSFFMFGIFGALAAGFSVYLAANSRLDDLVRLCFFALSCGIAFPAILLETQTKAAKEAQAGLKNATDVVEDATQPITKVAPAAAALATQAVAQAPANEVDSQTRAIVSDQTSTLINRLNQDQSAAATAAAQKVFQAATEAGYTDITAPTIAPPPMVNQPPPPAPPPANQM